MFYPWLRTFALLIVSLIGLSSTAAWSQTVQQEQAKLTQLEQRLSSLETERQVKQSALSTTRAQLSEASKADSPEKAQLQQAEQQLRAAEAQYNADPSSTNESKVKNLKFKFALAERKYKKANTEVASLQKNIDQIDSDLKTLSQQISSTTDEIKTQQTALNSAKARVSEQQRKASAQKQQQIAEEQRLKQLAAEAEIARLKAELAERDRAEKERAEAEKTQATAAVTATKAKAPVKPEQPQVAAKVDTPKQTAQAPQKADPSAPKITLLSDKAAAQSFQQQLEQLLQQEEKRKRVAYNKILNVKDSSGSAKAKTLKSIGANHFRCNAKLPAGDVSLSVGFSRWQQTIDPSIAGRDFVFILDNRNEKAPELVYFDKAFAI